MAEHSSEANDLAYDSLDHSIYQTAKTFPDQYCRIDSLDEGGVQAAYEYCRQVTRCGSRTFYFGARFLPYPKRRAMWAVYSFCRFTDDLVDNPAGAGPAELRARLSHWERELRQSFEGVVRPGLPHMIAWNDTARRFSIPAYPPLELIEGVRMDLEKTRYANFDELRLYCYRVASTVGLMASQVIGYRDPCALEYAINLGIAMQLTNILRDVGEDLRAGRIYLPQDEMSQFGYSEAELRRGVVNEPFVRLMQFQVARARHYYAQALPGIEYLSADCRLSISVAATLYSRILNVIERNGYDVFNQRAYVPRSQKIRGLVGTWLRRKFGRNFGAAPVFSTPSPHEEADA